MQFVLSQIWDGLLDAEAKIQICKYVIINQFTENILKYVVVSLDRN